jgi:hypothetical protein
MNKYLVYSVVTWTHGNTSSGIFKKIVWLPKNNIKNWARDPCEAAIASYGSLDFFKTLSGWRNYQKGFKFVFYYELCRVLTKLPDVRVISSPTQTKKKRGLDVGKGQKKPCQHLGPYFRQLLIWKKHCVMFRIFGEKKYFTQKWWRNYPIWRYCFR